MDNSKIKRIIFIIIIAALVIGGFVIFITNSTKNNIKKEKEDKSEVECIELMGGGFNLVFNTNGGENIDNIHVCIACSPDSYQNIPTPTKEENKFEGWYLDSELTKKFNITNTIDITPEQEFDENGCQIGYKDVTIYAKWNKNN